MWAGALGLLGTMPHRLLTPTVVSWNPAVVVDIGVNISVTILREMFYDRTPGDAPVKVESERKFATSPDHQVSLSPGSGFLNRDSARRGSPKSAVS